MAFDLASMMAMFGGGGAQPAAAMANPGAATPPTGAGFGLGQQLIQPPAVPGQEAQMAGQPAAGGLAGMMGQAGQMMQDPEKMQKLLMMMQMMSAQGQGQGQQAGMAPMMNQMGRPAMGNTQASKGYLSSGGGLAKAQY